MRPIRPIVSVHIDIAILLWETSKHQSDADLAKWTRDLVECLVMRDPNKSEFGAKLLSEATEFRAKEANRKKKTSYLNGFEGNADSEENQGNPRNPTENQGNPRNPPTDRQTDSKKERNTPVVPSEGTPQNRKPQKWNPEQTELPEKLLAIPGFHEAWIDWCKTRSERRKPITETTAKHHIQQLCEFADPISAIRKSILNGYQGLFGDTTSQGLTSAEIGKPAQQNPPRRAIQPAPGWTPPPKHVVEPLPELPEIAS